MEIKDNKAGSQSGASIPRKLSRVYLAGGLHTNWQGRVISMLDDRKDVEFLNPMDLQDGSLSLAQIADRERDMIDSCDAVLFFMEKTNPFGQCGFAEAARAAAHATVILVCDNPDNSMVKWLASFLRIHLWDNLEDGVVALRKCL